MTDTTPAPKRTPAAKTTAATKSTAAAKKPVAAKVPAKATPKATIAAIEPTPSTAVAPAVLAPAVEAPIVSASAPAGWYPVAVGSASQRWWDGAQWTEHVYEPPIAAQPVAAAPGAGAPFAAAEPLRAATGVKPGTVWFWLLAVGAPVLTILELIPTSIYLSQVIGGVTTDPTSAVAGVFSPAYLLVLLSGWFIYILCIVFGLLDWRELKARGVPKPFHWAWGFSVLVVGFPAVYAIGRTVVVKRRTGSGMAPLWVFIGLEVVTFIVSVVVVITALIQLFALLGDGLSAAGNVL